MQNNKEGKDIMKRNHVVINVFVLALVLQAIIPSIALAYIDPGTGSYLFQMLMAGLLGSLFAVKMAWRNIKCYFSRFFSSQDDSQEHEND